MRRPTKDGSSPERPLRVGIGSVWFLGEPVVTAATCATSRTGVRSNREPVDAGAGARNARSQEVSNSCALARALLLPPIRKEDTMNPKGTYNGFYWQ